MTIPVLTKHVIIIISQDSQISVCNSKPALTSKHRNQASQSYGQNNICDWGMRVGPAWTLQTALQSFQWEPGGNCSPERTVLHKRTVMFTLNYPLFFFFTLGRCNTGACNHSNQFSCESLIYSRHRGSIGEKTVLQMRTIGLISDAKTIGSVWDSYSHKGKHITLSGFHLLSWSSRVKAISSCIPKS